MKIVDLSMLALSNLWRTKLRSFLTTLGVIIGIGALFAMVSFGTGMQHNVTRVFRENDLFTSLQVLPRKVNMEDILAGNVEALTDSALGDGPVLDDIALGAIQSLPNVEIAFPEIRFPVRVQLGDRDARTTLQALPSAMGHYRPFDELLYGQFFDSDVGFTAVLTQRLLEKLSIRVHAPSHPAEISPEDSLRGIRALSPDSLLNREIQVFTSIIDVSRLLQNPSPPLPSAIQTSFREQVTRFQIAGIRKMSEGFSAGRFNSGVIIPLKAAEQIPRLGFSSVWDLLGKERTSDVYSSLYVRLKGIDGLDPVRKAIEAMGFGVLSFADQFEELKRQFLFFDAALGAVGTIALVVASLGIMNTMVMSILERTREIGIMKATGASEPDIMRIFFVEAGMIGLNGGVFGLALGWIVTRLSNVIANHYIRPQGFAPIDFFHFPLWLILGALAFSIIVSLLAGLYPAIRAARVDPVNALRHD